MAIAPLGTVTLTAGGDLAPYRLKWQRHSRWGGKETFALTATGDLGPVFNIPGALALPAGHGNQLHHHRYDRTRVLNHTVNVVGMSSANRQFLGNSPEYDGTYLTWSGECLRALLELDYQDMLDILPDKNGAPGPMASSVAREIGAKYGVTIAWDAPDYRVNVLRRSGTPWSWLEKLMKPLCLAANWRNGQLVIRARQLTGAGKRTYRDHVNIVAGSMRFMEVWGDKRNQFTVARLDEAGGILGAKSDKGGKILGDQNSLDFDFPTRSAFVRPDATKTNVDLLLFLFYDVDGNVINDTGTDGNYVGATPAVRMTWTCGEKLGATTTGPPAIGIQQGTVYTLEYSLIVLGGGRTSSDKPIPYTKGPFTSGGLFGTRPEKSIVTYQEISDNATAELAADALVNENECQVYACAFRTFLDPAIEVGDRVTVIHDKTAQAGTNWAVEEKVESADGGYWMDLLCIKGIA